MLYTTGLVHCNAQAIDGTCGIACLQIWGLAKLRYMDDCSIGFCYLEMKCNNMFATILVSSVTSASINDRCSFQLATAQHPGTHQLPYIWAALRHWLAGHALCISLLNVLAVLHCLARFAVGVPATIAFD